MSAVPECLEPHVVEVILEGPQGPSGIALPVAVDQPVQGSLIYFDAALEAFRAEGVTTVEGLLERIAALEQLNGELLSRLAVIEALVLPPEPEPEPDPEPEPPAG